MSEQMTRLPAYFDLPPDRELHYPGGYKILPDRLPNYIVPDLTGFKVSPSTRSFFNGRGSVKKCHVKSSMYMQLKPYIACETKPAAKET